MSDKKEITWQDVWSVTKTVSLLYGPTALVSVLQMFLNFNYGKYTFIVTAVIGILLKVAEKYNTKTIYPLQ